MIFIKLILLILFIYLVMNVLYLLLFAIAGKCRKQPPYPVLEDKKKIAVLVPAYKEDRVILETARQALLQDYPLTSFTVFILADRLQFETLEELVKLPLKVIQVSFIKSTKAKAIKYALQQIKGEEYDIVMILDADNIMGAGCLEKINSAFHSGWRMVQLHRAAKNKNTPTAILDAASEEINNHIFRQGHRALGVSSALIGSGMAFDFGQFKKLMMNANIEDNPGEDREIYLEMLRQGYECEYIEDAYVYDEKVQSGQVLEKQRTRWLSAQLQYAVRFWIKEPVGTCTSNIHYFDYALQTLLIPRVVLLGVTFLLSAVVILLQILFRISPFPGLSTWLIIFAGCILSLMLSLHGRLSLKEIWCGIRYLPHAFIAFSRAMSRSKAGQQEFIHTPKDYSNLSKSL